MRECARNRKELEHWTKEGQEISREESKEKWEKQEMGKNKIEEWEQLDKEEQIS